MPNLDNLIRRARIEPSNAQDFFDVIATHIRIKAQDAIERAIMRARRSKSPIKALHGLPGHISSYMFAEPMKSNPERSTKQQRLEYGDVASAIDLILGQQDHFFYFEVRDVLDYEGDPRTLKNHVVNYARDHRLNHQYVKMGAKIGRAVIYFKGKTRQAVTPTDKVRTAIANVKEPTHNHIKTFTGLPDHTIYTIMGKLNYVSRGDERRMYVRRQHQ